VVLTGLPGGGSSGTGRARGSSAVFLAGVVLSGVLDGVLVEKRMFVESSGDCRGFCRAADVFGSCGTLYLRWSAQGRSVV